MKQLPESEAARNPVLPPRGLMPVRPVLLPGEAAIDGKFSTWFQGTGR